MCGILVHLRVIGPLVFVSMTGRYPPTKIHMPARRLAARATTAGNLARRACVRPLEYVMIANVGLWRSESQLTAPIHVLRVDSAEPRERSPF